MWSRTLFCLGFALFSCSGKPSKEDLGPRLSALTPRTMYVLDMGGDVANARSATIGRLYEAVSRADVAVPPGEGAPRVRWMTATSNGPEARAVAAVPVREAKGPPAPYADVRIETWYGEKAVEAVHVGPWSEIAGTEQRVRAFAASNGLVVVGPREEIYLKGPTAFYDGEPSKYRTVVRFTVQPAGTNAP